MESTMIGTMAESHLLWRRLLIQVSIHRYGANFIGVTMAADAKQWCSFCNDFRDRLLLCAGCRVAMCSAVVGSTRGCVPWNASMDRADFIFICPYCAETNQDPGPSTVRPATHFVEPKLMCTSSSCLGCRKNFRRNGTFHSDMTRPSSLYPFAIQIDLIASESSFETAYVFPTGTTKKL